MIPKILHYVWVGSAEVPAKQREFIATWQETNPDYQIIRWSEKNIDFTKEPIKRAYEDKKWAKVADIVRLMAVAEHGGIYLDSDFKVFKPLDPMLEHNCFWGFQVADSNSSDLVANGVFGATPDHWFIRAARDRVLAMRRMPFGLERPTAFGPKLITKMLRENGLKGYDPGGVMVKDIYVAPIPVFFPFGWDEEFTPDCIKPETLAAHFWHRSWEGSINPAARIAKQLYHLVRR